MSPARAYLINCVFPCAFHKNVIVVLPINNRCTIFSTRDNTYIAHTDVYIDS